MTRKVERFTVHKNTADKRKKREQSLQMIEDAKLIARDKQVAGYAIVAWTKDFESSTCYETGGTIPQFMVPDFAKGALRYSVHKRTREGSE